MSSYQDQFDVVFEREWARNPDLAKTDKEAARAKMIGLNKKMGQLVAKSWLYKSYPEGEKIRNVLIGNLNKKKAEKSKEIIEFFKSNYDIDIENLGGVFPVESVEVSWDTFYGDIPENGREYVLPYPPRPTEVTDEQLEQWINDGTSNNFPSTPYIPLTFF
jgi:hypothetical protein